MFHHAVDVGTRGIPPDSKGSNSNTLAHNSLNKLMKQLVIFAYVCMECFEELILYFDISLIFYMNLND